ncbi:palmitoyl-monogalactosyldiacylglycerol delta-7 desaturase, chloroplastic-like [Argentina anserina]|uniref:palmitoyl-monogalactosyldiacylglycerol delta-7 desaturase, chloroplastic-like n=1 Tax=Argentina anserina TaxID=57926 RepID=UPI0021762D82|nr:palmitoyl-monogalactosyldiacylglycerol delta-7 desaturase, chloroplastic-like [Potentilla anserina]
MPYRVINLQVDWLGRKWDFMDLYYLTLITSAHLLCFLAPFHFTWGALKVAYVLYLLSGVGVTLSYHRHLSHRSFKMPKWLEYYFAYCAVLSLQGSPLEWVSTHRFHHQVTDKENDPHTPSKGFWFSHVNWAFDYHARWGSYDGQLMKNVGDLECQAFYRFLHYTYPYHSVLLGVILYVTGGLPYVIWGMFVRLVVVAHATAAVNSFCHTWGKQIYDTGDESKNNWVFGLLSQGEGWHNNHHAFEYSARHGLEWWQVDLTWYVIKLLQILGLATDVKLPTESQKQRKALAKNAVLEGKIN